MPYEYSDPKREQDQPALPNIEVYFIAQDEIARGERDDIDPEQMEGYYWQAGLPGCLPDGDPVGPFATYADALADAQAQGECDV